MIERILSPPPHLSEVSPTNTILKNLSSFHSHFFLIKKSKIQVFKYNLGKNAEFVEIYLVDAMISA